MSFILTVLVGSTVLLAAATLAAWSLRKASASTRHALWAISMGGLLLLPLAEGLLPKLELPVLPPLAVPEEEPVDEWAPNVSPLWAPGMGSSATSASTISPAFEPGEGEAMGALVPIATEPSLVAWTFRDGLLAVWALGALIIIGRLLIGTWSVRRLWKQAAVAAEGDWRTLLDDLRSRMGVQGGVEIRISDEPIPPMTLGVFGRAMLLPRDAAGWSQDRRLAVLAHELAHVRRRDGLTQILVQLVQAMYWLHPLAWHAVRRLADERERAADDQVLAIDSRRGEYAGHLVEVTRAIGSGVSLATLTMAEPSRLEMRLLAILNPETSRQAVSRFAVALVVIGVSLVTLPAATLRLTAVVAAPVQAPAAEGRLEQGELAIYGTVRVPRTLEPVSGARVRLRPSGDGAFWVGPGAEERFAVADESGRFRFDSLAPGRYSLVPMAFEDGDDPVNSGRAAVELVSNGPSPEVNVWLAPKSRISGRITNEDGEPIEGADVGVNALGWAYGQQVLGAVMEAPFPVPTDENGRYVLTVEPGEYYLRAAVPGEGRVPQLYPGVLFPEDAVTVRVSPGIDVPGIDMSLRRVEEVRLRFDFAIPEFISGIAEPLASYIPEGVQPLQIRVVPMGGGQIAAPQHRLGFEQRGEEYVTDPLPPGQYDLVLQYSNDARLALSRGGIDIVETRIPDVLARFSATIDGREPGGELDLGVIPGVTTMSVPGRIVPPNSVAGTFDWSTMRGFYLAGWPVGTTNAIASIGPEGVVVFDGVTPGLYSLQWSPGSLPDGWYVRAFRSGSRDIQLDGLEVGSAPVPLVEMVLADDGAEITGVVRNSDGQPVAGGSVLLIPPASRRGRFSRLIRAEADPFGTYVLDAVPPGEYRVLAVDLAGIPEANQWESPDFLRQYELRGELITVDPGARLTINPEAIPLVD